MTSRSVVQTPSLLIVDDHAMFRSAVRAVLDGTFDVVGEAASGEEAVELAARLEPDLIVMDVHLPGIDGLEATRRITAANRDTVVVLVSTQHQRTLRTTPRECGAAGFLRKDDLDAPALAAFLG